MFGYGLAFVGSADNTAIKQLLHSAVSDVNDDVRRAALISLGFVLMNNPSKIPKLISLLSESYNPHVRYGAALALGIACANTGNTEAISILEKACSKDSVDYVRQGALIALAFVCVNQTESMIPKLKEITKLFTSIIGDKHEDSITKFGASIASGIINAGGRNLIVKNGGTQDIQSNQPNTLVSTAVGFFLFCQSWYWFPLSFFVNLVFQPAMLCAINKDCMVPKFSSKMDCPSGVSFEYPESSKEPTINVAEKVGLRLNLGRYCCSFYYL